MSNVKVVCRFRPPNALELKEAGNEPVVILNDEGNSVKLKSQEGMKGPDATGFTFDRVFPMQTKQVEVFEYGVKGIVEDVLSGYNGTVFAYGQTGSGKTFTMMGSDIDSGEHKGIIPRITEHIFESIMSSPENIEYLVKVSYMEIYMEKIRDLLAPHNDNLPIHEDKSRGVYVKNLSDYYVGSAPEVYEIMRQGGEARKVSSTIMNAESSRSHSIFVITIQQKHLETGTQKSGNLFLVDLAGSEKVGKTGASGQTLEEAKKINKSLSALGMVINALTDGKSAHIPYRDSKLTRILQESLGGNSRTTLVINCSPSAYNEAETLSTLRFGMRAKSIKNKARVNAELSSAELKALLKKAQSDSGRQLSYIALLERELTIWRSGGQVSESDWATMERALGVKLNVSETGTVTLGSQKSNNSGRETPSTPNSNIGAKPQTFANIPALDALRDLGTRPETPIVGLEKDEREEFLRRENELSDQLAEKEEALAKQERTMQEIQEELSFFKEQESSMSAENKVMASELNELRLQVEKFSYENKEALILSDATREQNHDLSNELEELKKTIADLKAAQKSINDEGKQRKKAEKMAQLMAGFESTAVSEKEDEIRATLQKLDDAANVDRPLSAEDLLLLKRQLTDSQILANESGERARKAQEEIDLLSRRKEELENRLTLLEQDYEDLLERASAAVGAGNINNGDDTNELESIKAKLEAQAALKREATLLEITDLKQQLDIKAHENKSLLVTIENMKSANEELKRAFAVTAAGIEGGKDLAESAKEMERIRKTMATQLSEFDGMKKSLMRDLQNRCEKVIELEISLDETREQYNNVLRNSNSKAQQRKMEFLTRNLDQLTNVQKQLVEQNSMLKKDVAIAERKLLARNDRITSLETMLGDAQEKLNAQNAKFEAQLNAVRERLNQARTQQEKAPIGGGLVFGRIAKPLRGGGGAGATDAAVVDSSKRTSWFSRK
ncbi:P-loop containing nucleoside triphosphate hydrolase protein [Phakopsora pachyrhizi]|uniref:P-loop containing nucleoside triphosphate hydrolase protein n=1 Tax=Phakopsora pachyrhizi TaxID=170000 RepID=A0AAV0BE16_PHAPC|nr:P-loop containing nucleoside triphosphate hydrolase protein [Phakopsora pachyrhizi]CAH7684123.1 P-loop containing nucleoside triphosphate hydrolase protein [Phakopsora pachyrhizi]